MTREKDALLNFQQFDETENVTLGDGRVVKALGAGEVYMKMQFQGSELKRAILYNVLYVPKLACYLFSERAAVARGNMVEFSHNQCWIKDGSGKLRGMGSLADKLYQLDCDVITDGHASVASTGSNDLWHCRLGHVHEQRLKKCVNKGLVEGISIGEMTELSFCSGCGREDAL